ncbi:MAG TPA: hypothetical protein VFI31_21125, partial [Pirellulales bacterium]|nr:hypothetical protein [Pirellulales bacterium]
MFSQLEFDPLISPVLWAAFALLAAVVLARYAWKRPPSVYRRRWAGIVALMAAGTLLPLVILLNPTWRVTIPPPAGKPILSLLVDLSASMSATDVAGGSSRYQAAAAIAKACTHELSEQFDVQTFGFSSHLLAADAETLHDNEPRGESTDLALAISEAVANDTAASQTLLLLSDGIHNAEGGTSSVLAALSAARAAAVPIYTKTLGGDVEIDDLALQLSTPQQLAFIEQSVPLSVKVRKVGRAPSKVTLVLEQDDKEISRQQVTLSADGQAQTRFLVRQDTPGVFRYEVRVEPFDGEISQVNNFATFLLRVVD